MFLLVFSGCAFFGSTTISLNEREMLFEKGKALVAAEEFSKAEPFFLSLTAEPITKSDSIYDLSLWNISLIYTKLSLPEKSILALNLLKQQKSEFVSTFIINAALMKNYFLVDNKLVALKFKKMLDEENPKTAIGVKTLFTNLQQILNLNYDQFILQELDFLGEIQKYLLYVIEQNDFIINRQAVELLISKYERIYSLTLNDRLGNAFKEKILISILDKLRQFNLYKLNDININLKTVAKFSRFSEKMEMQITDRLHR